MCRRRRPLAPPSFRKIVSTTLGPRPALGVAAPRGQNPRPPSRRPEPPAEPATAALLRRERRTRPTRAIFRPSRLAEAQGPRPLAPRGQATRKREARRRPEGPPSLGGR